MKISKFLATLLLLVIAGCASVKLDIDTLKPDKNIKTGLPVDANVMVYIAVPYFNKEKDKKQVSDFEKREMIKKIINLGFLQDTSLDIARKYFKNVDYFDPSKKASLVVLLSGNFSTEFAFGSLTSNVVASVYGADGKLLYQAELTDTEVTGGPINDASLYNAITRAQLKMYDQLFSQKSDEIMKYPSSSERDMAEFYKSLEQSKIKEIGSASGFLVNSDGMIVTNFHAVKSCLKVTVGVDDEIYDAKVIATDKDIDLALLKIDYVTESYAKLADENYSARLGDDAIVMGYPLQGVLTSKPSLTTGNISALAGINDDENVYQLTAPIQAGNSGGPLLNHKGQVIGVIQSKLNAIRMAKYSGDLPQNVNFAIKSKRLLDFLKSNGIQFAISKNTERVSTPDIGEQAMKFTNKMSCQGYATLL